MNKKITLTDFNNYLENTNLHRWLENYLTNRLGVNVSIFFLDSIFKLVFTQDLIKFTFTFSSCGRNDLFLEKPEVHYISISRIKKEIDINSDFDLVAITRFNHNIVFSLIDTSEIHINYDLVSLLIFVLNRVEEYGYQSNEIHERFELNKSILRIDNIYSRPIIDEWIIVISKILEKQNFKIIKTKFSFRISHDVDNISRYRSVPFIRLIPTFIFDLIKKPKYLFSYLKNTEYFLKNESINTFEWLMNVSDYFNIKSNFYFIINNTSLRYDYRYNYTRNTKNLITNIYKRGHNIGIHYSYSSSKRQQISFEWNKLNILLLNMLGIIPNGGRMHYLRFNFPETLLQLDKTDQKFDETLTFHETGGFRCGSCFTYAAFNFTTFTEFKIKIKPLILMEASSLYYMNYDIMQTKNYILHLIQQCFKVNGEFTLLWHNSELDEKNKKIYYECVEYCSSLV